MNPLHAYLDGWRRHDVPAVLEALTEACVVVDLSGTVLRGRDAVGESMRGWLSDGGSVHAMEVTEELVADGVITAHWRADVTWQGARVQLEGHTVAHLRDGGISYLRDYALGGPLGDWDGTWAS